MMGTAHYKRLVLDLCRAFNEGKIARIDDYLTPDFQELGMPGGADWFVGTLRTLRRSFTEARWEVLGLVAEGTTVVVRLKLTGVHTGEYLGVLPTRSAVEVEQVHIYEGRDGRLATHLCVRDDLQLLGQLGIHPDTTAVGETKPMGKKMAMAAAKVLCPGLGAKLTQDA
jgi:predicted ester cyclase